MPNCQEFSMVHVFKNMEKKNPYSRVFKNATIDKNPIGDFSRIL